MTDGEENCSKEFNLKTINSLIKARGKSGWDFVYMGANHDAWSTAKTLGLSAGNSVQYNSVNVKGTFSGAASATLRYATSNATGTAISSRSALFNKAERAVMESKTAVDDADTDLIKTATGS
jgi:hypothetical protein